MEERLLKLLHLVRNDPDNAEVWFYVGEPNGTGHLTLGEWRQLIQNALAGVQ